MRHLSLLLVCGCACLGILSAQTPLYEISVPPVFVTQSYYDYMIGGYHDLPVAEFSPDLNSGRVMVYHARRGSYSGLRKVYFSYVDAEGQLQTVVDPWQDWMCRWVMPRWPGTKAPEKRSMPGTRATTRITSWKWCSCTNTIR
ncbi:MAG: hypothetical protein LHW57_05200 [Candidatus Cloacimonetes bacterium]|nr:hypothetical protein [Candidatus Cloacimonadota bacterium]